MMSKAEREFLQLKEGEAMELMAAKQLQATVLRARLDVLTAEMDALHEELCDVLERLHPSKEAEDQAELDFGDDHWVLKGDDWVQH